MASHADHDLATGGVGFGQRPALIVVDMTNGFTSPDSPLGGEFSHEVESAALLVAAFHARELPVFFSSVVYDCDEQNSVFRAHLPDLNILKRGSKWVNVDERLPLTTGDRIVEKGGPSAFFHTGLNDMLLHEKCDSTMICGLTTSGCVRATVVDALQYNYPTWVIEDACGDRNQSAHKANLHDMHAKYAQVVSLQEALAHLRV